MTAYIAYDYIDPDNKDKYLTGPISDYPWGKYANVLILGSGLPLVQKKTEELLDAGVKFGYPITWRSYFGYEMHHYLPDINNKETEHIAKQFAFLKEPKLHAALKDGRCLLILHDGGEGDPEASYGNYNWMHKFDRLAEFLEMPKKNIIFADGNFIKKKHETPDTIRFMSENVFEFYMFHFLHTNNKSCFNLKHPLIKPKRYLSYSRHWNHMRQNVTFDLFARDLLKDGLVSLSRSNIENKEQELTHFISYYNYYWAASEEEKLVVAAKAKQFIDSLPYILDDTLEFNLAMQVYPNHFLDADITLLNETHASKHVIFPTEKTFKTIMMKHPFIMMSSPGMMRHLRDDLGYQTFHPILDESYDDEVNLPKRKNLVLKTLEDFCKLTETERIKKRQALDEITEFNFDHFTKYRKRHPLGKNVAQAIIEHCGENNVQP